MWSTNANHSSVTFGALGRQMFRDGSIPIEAFLPCFVTRFGKPQNAIAKKEKKLRPLHSGCGTKQQKASCSSAHKYKAVSHKLVLWVWASYSIHS